MDSFVIIFLFCIFILGFGIGLIVPVALRRIREAIEDLVIAYTNRHLPNKED